MSDDIIKIPRFGGMITNPQQEDIPDTSAAYNLNVDPEAESGSLKGLPANGASYTANGTAIPDVYKGRFISYISTGQKYDLVYIDKDDNDITVIENFYAAEASRVFNDLITSPSAAPTDIAMFNNAAQIGLGIGSTDEPITVYRQLTTKDFFGYISLTISNATNATPIEITTTATHGMATGEYITISGVGGNTAANGTWAVTVTAPTTFTLDTSVGNGAYTSGGTAVYGQRETAGLKYTNAICRNIGNSAGGFTVSPVFHTGTAGFPIGRYYSAGVSIVYDGVQESNLSTTQALTSADSDYVTITITAHGGENSFSSFDKRITAIKIYWAESTDNQVANLGLHRLIKTIGINESTWADGAADSTYAFVFTPLTSEVEGGTTYEEETGIPETINPTYINYTLNTVGAGYHFVANGYVPVQTKIPGTDITDWSRYIFRSQKFRPNMFNWTTDALPLPEVPTAINFYQGKLYAFGLNTVYRIDPELFIIEDQFDGVGANNQAAVTVTEFGMFFANSIGAYRLLGNDLKVISDPISVSSSTLTGVISFRTHVSYAISSPADLGRIIVLYESQKRCVIFFAQLAAGAAMAAYAYYLPTEEWYYWSIGISTIASDSGAFNGKDGEIYVSNQSAMVRLFSGATFRDFDWYSKEFNYNAPSQNKLWKKIKWDAVVGTGTMGVKYGTNGALPTTSTATNDAYINTYKKTMQLAISGTGNARLDSVDILVRGLDGAR